MCTGILFVPLLSPTPGGRLYKKFIIPMPEEIRRPVEPDGVFVLKSMAIEQNISVFKS